MQALAELLRDARQPVYVHGEYGADHVAVWKYGTSRWQISFSTPNGSAGVTLRSRVNAARYALALAAADPADRIHVPR
jgi:hypothetical protein